MLFFQALSSPVKKKQLVTPVKQTSTTNNVVNTTKIVEEKPKAVKPILKTLKKRTSSLSLKSIHQKKEVAKVAVEENYDDYPKDLFSEKELQVLWKEYITILNKKGEKSIASIIGTDIPKLEKDFKIYFSVPNKLMQDQFKKGRPKLLKFLREKLNNYGIEIIEVLNETVEKKFAYTPQEKYNKLKEKNPLLDKLRQSFELDL